MKKATIGNIAIRPLAQFEVLSQREIKLSFFFHGQFPAILNIWHLYMDVDRPCFFFKIDGIHSEVPLLMPLNKIYKSSLRLKQHFLQHSWLWLVLFQRLWLFNTNPLPSVFSYLVPWWPTVSSCSRWNRHHLTLDVTPSLMILWSTSSEMGPDSFASNCYSERRHTLEL